MLNMGDIGVLTAVAVASLAMSVRAVMRLVRRRPTFRWLGITALVCWTVIALVAGGFEIRHQWVQHVASGVVQDVSGKPDASASCVRRTADMLDMTNTAGRVDYENMDVAVLRADTCVDLASWMAGSKTDPALDEVTAVHVLVHESVHVGGEFREAVTECVAMSLDAQVAESLGASHEDALALARTYAEQVYPYMRADYRTDCATALAAEAEGTAGR